MQRLQVPWQWLDSKVACRSCSGLNVPVQSAQYSPAIWESDEVSVETQVEMGEVGQMAVNWDVMVTLEV